MRSTPSPDDSALSTSLYHLVLTGSGKIVSMPPRRPRIAVGPLPSWHGSSPSAEYPTRAESPHANPADRNAYVAKAPPADARRDGATLSDTSGESLGREKSELIRVPRIGEAGRPDHYRGWASSKWTFRIERGLPHKISPTSGARGLEGPTLGVPANGPSRRSAVRLSSRQPERDTTKAYRDSSTATDPSPCTRVGHFASDCSAKASSSYCGTQQHRDHGHGQHVPLPESHELSRESFSSTSMRPVFPVETMDIASAF